MTPGWLERRLVAHARVRQRLAATLRVRATAVSQTRRRSRPSMCCYINLVFGGRSEAQGGGEAPLQSCPELSSNQVPLTRSPRDNYQFAREPNSRIAKQYSSVFNLVTL